VIGRVASSPAISPVWIRPFGTASALKAGDEVQFRPGGSHDIRCGVAVVREVNEHGWADFGANLNALVPAVCEGDIVEPYERPCTRCRCKACDIPIASSPDSRHTLDARGMPNDLDALEATVVAMRRLGVTKWNGIELGPEPTAKSGTEDEPSEPQAQDPKEQRARRERVAALASGGPVKLGDRP
jgi:hypothetical protein